MAQPARLFQRAATTPERVTFGTLALQESLRSASLGLHAANPLGLSDSSPTPALQRPKRPSSLNKIL